MLDLESLPSYHKNYGCGLHVLTAGLDNEQWGPEANNNKWGPPFHHCSASLVCK